jgi:hypothetical protein
MLSVIHFAAFCHPVSEDVKQNNGIVLYLVWGALCDFGLWV